MLKKLIKQKSQSRATGTKSSPQNHKVTSPFIVHLQNLTVFFNFLIFSGFTVVQSIKIYPQNIFFSCPCLDRCSFMKFLRALFPIQIYSQWTSPQTLKVTPISHILKFSSSLYLLSFPGCIRLKGSKFNQERNLIHFSKKETSFIPVFSHAFNAYKFS